jgi:hypothetical protein
VTRCQRPRSLKGLYLSMPQLCTSMTSTLDQSGLLSVATMHDEAVHAVATGIVSFCGRWQWKGRRFVPRLCQTRSGKRWMNACVFAMLSEISMRFNSILPVWRTAWNRFFPGCAENNRLSRIPSGSSLLPATHGPAGKRRCPTATVRRRSGL